MKFTGENLNLTESFRNRNETRTSTRSRSASPSRTCRSERRYA